jgi:hemolysin activation/secretion protein
MEHPLAACLLSLVLAAGGAAVLFPGSAIALERNPPPTAPGSGANGLLPPNVTTADTDDRPLGPKVTALVFLGLSDPPASAAGGRIDAHRVPMLDDPLFEQKVAPFLGRPISGRLIAEVEAEVAGFYRLKGYPFVSVSTPPQEISDGTLRFRVIEFRAGPITVSGNKRATDRQILERIRLEAGERIASRPLAEDLDWLNRSPFRRVTAQFSPGKTLGITDLDLKVSEDRPWSVYAGYANSGTLAEGRDRYFVGAVVGDYLGLGSLFSVQVTGSPDFWYADGDLFGDSEPAYGSIATASSIPLAARLQLEATFEAIETNTSDTFDVRETTIDGSLGIRTSAYDLAGLPGDLALGVEASHQRKVIDFADVTIGEPTLDVYQLYVGWNRTWTAGGFKGSFDGRVHVSPGDLDTANSDDAFSIYTSGRVTEATYAYATGRLDLQHNLPARFAFATSLFGQAATGPLPDVEQATLGGASAVRGYVADDGSYDWIFISRNELLLPPAELSTIPAFPVLAAPYLFADLGYGADADHGSHASALSLGLGTSLNLGRSLLFDVDAGYALTDAPVTKKGDWAFDVRATGRY